MNVILYGTSSDRRKLNKTLTTLNEYNNVVLKDSPNSLTDPTITVGTFSTWKQCNYMYIAEFGRYYFVNDIRELSGGRIEIVAHVDVLMSNKERIKALKAIINRSSSVANSYLVDGEQGVLNYRNQKILNFPVANKFNQSLQYVLTVAGGEGSV